MFGRTGNFDWRDACGLCVEHRLHASFFVEKLWSYFIPVPPSASERAALETTYVAGGYAVRPVVEAILLHPQLLDGPADGQAARGVRGRDAAPAAPGDRHRAGAGSARGWASACSARPTWPAGTTRSGWTPARCAGAGAPWRELLNGRHIRDGAMEDYPDDETPEQAVLKARAFWGDPAMTADGLAALQRFAATCLPGRRWPTGSSTSTGPSARTRCAT